VHSLIRIVIYIHQRLLLHHQAITDEKTKEQYQDSIPSDEEGRIDIELVEKTVESIFLKQMSGKFDGEEVTCVQLEQSTLSFHY
jgi:hypothetical protein